MTAKAHLLGTHRTVPPAETVARLRPLMPALGITRLADVTGLDRIGVPVFQAVRPLSRSVSVSQGKGLDAVAARASALMEAAETWHAERAEVPLRLARERDLRVRGLPLVDTDALPRVAGSAYGPGSPILWAEGRGLGTGRPAWVPYEIVHTDYTLPLPAGSGHFLASTNGLASGNARDEAVCHGLCELVERDAVTLWFRLDARAQAASAVDLATVDDPACRGTIDRVRAAGLDLVAWDATSDLGVPAFLCLLLDAREPEVGHGGLGAGCHPAREVALLRALTEAVQVRMTYISGARDDIAAGEYSSGTRAERLATARRLAAHRAATGLEFRELPTRAHPDFAANLAWLLERLGAAGLDEPIVVDLSRPEIGVAVVRVVAPGLEGPDDHPSYAPGRRARGDVATERA